MYFEHIFDEDLAQSSYLIGCQAQGTAVVVDPRRDIDVYLQRAERQGLRIVAVTETHIHADYLSGSRELAHATGAELYLSHEGDEDWKYAFGDVLLQHGDQISIGNVRLAAIHTPGHTPEHLSFLVTDRATSEIPTILLSGDFVFVGDVGRPDLLDEAAGFTDTRFAGARDLFRSLRDRFLTLPDHVQVWPGHGAGSACGKALGAVPSTTVGYERLTSWWSAFVRDDDCEGFTAALLEGQPDAPSYFGRMKRLNKAGPALLGERGDVPELTTEELEGDLGDRLVLLDTRSADRFRADTVAGSLFVPNGQNFVTYASYAIDPERDPRPMILLAHGQAEANRLRDTLSRVGIDRIEGYVDTLDGLPRRPIDSVEPSELHQLGDTVVLDVRTANEYDAEHIPGARHIHVGKLAARVEDLPKDRPIVVHCQMGGRAAVAEGILRDAGFDRVIDLAGSFDAWKAIHKE